MTQGSWKLGPWRRNANKCEQRLNRLYSYQVTCFVARTLRCERKAGRNLSLKRLGSYSTRSSGQSSTLQLAGLVRLKSVSRMLSKLEHACFPKLTQETWRLGISIFNWLWAYDQTPVRKENTAICSLFQHVICSAHFILSLSPLITSFG